MDQFWLGLGAIVGLALVGLFFWLHWRLRKLESANLLVMEKLKDEKIVDRVKGLSDAELNALLLKDLKSGNTEN